jgi:hypothetical protein
MVITFRRAFLPSPSSRFPLPCLNTNLLFPLALSFRLYTRLRSIASRCFIRVVVVAVVGTRPAELTQHLFPTGTKSNSYAM